MKQTKCPKCNGTGKVVDQKALGQEIRNARQKSGMSGRELARRLNISAPYLSDLERGNRIWSEPMLAAAQTIIERGEE